MNIAEWLNQAKRRLAAVAVESPSIEAQMLAAHVLLVDRAFVLTHPNDDFPDLAGEQLLQRREAHEPLAYIIGSREFYGRRFRVAPGVLVPRQETETLVEAALGFLEGQTFKVLDLGTGSGCIGITLKLERPQAEVTLSDISPQALSIAQENAEALSADVRLVLSDLFRDLVGESFDLIVTNPPYVGLHEALPTEVREFEPAEALYSGHTGLEVYEVLSQTAAEYLRDGGRLMMEVGYRQARDVALIFESAGWTVVETINDLSGTERVVVVEPVFACGATT